MRIAAMILLDSSYIFQQVERFCCWLFFAGITLGVIVWLLFRLSKHARWNRASDGSTISYRKPAFALLALAIVMIGKAGYDFWVNRSIQKAPRETCGITIGKPKSARSGVKITRFKYTVKRSEFVSSNVQLGHQGITKEDVIKKGGKYIVVFDAANPNRCFLDASRPCTD